MSNKEFAQEILKVMRALKKNGAKVSFDPNIRKELFTDDSINDVINEVMENVSVFLPGEEELLLTMNAETVEEAIEKCFQLPDLEIVVLKRGSKGTRVYTKEKQFEVFPYKVVQVDATGAGDCYDGAFLAGLCQGKSLEEAAKMGAAAGALNAAAFGPMEGKISADTVWGMING